jgi:hypothetical protein
MATDNKTISMNLHPPGVDQLDGVKKVTRAFEDLIYETMEAQTVHNRVQPQAK